jgi:GntR family transcriptional regulator
MGALKPTAQPLYRQVKQDLVKRVLSGEWRPGHILPSEFKLADEYGLSQGTVRKAIEAMAQEGLVTRQAGKGTFVTSHDGDYRPFRFHKFYTNNGQRIASDDAYLISAKPAFADKKIAESLEIPNRAAGTQVVRLRRVEGEPLLYERFFLSEQLCPGAEAAIKAENPGSIYSFVERHYNLLITKVTESLRAREASADERALLGMPIGAAVLEAQRVAYSLGGEPVEWRLIVGAADKTVYANEIG